VARVLRTAQRYVGATLHATLTCQTHGVGSSGSGREAEVP